MTKEDYKVLAGVEKGMKNFEVVPLSLCMQLAQLRTGGAHKVMSSLLRDKLLSHDGSKGYDGYRLTNSGYDILALKNLVSKGLISALGDKIGIGKESDIYIAATPDGRQVVLKFHRLGRNSFRAVRNKRDYLSAKTGGGTNNTWIFMSRLSALKEYAFMKALHEVGYPTPTPLGHSRHIVVMSLVRGVPLYQVRAKWEVSTAQAESIFNQSVALASRLAKHGLVHCDLNEFNLMVDLSGIQSGDNVGDHYVRHSGKADRSAGALSAPAFGKEAIVDGTGERITEAPTEPSAYLSNGEPVPIVTLIDFPQMVSTKHPNAKELYERDVECLIKFMTNKLLCRLGDGAEDMRSGWAWEDVTMTADGGDGGDVAVDAETRLDAEVKASGFSGHMRTDLELYYVTKRQTGGAEERGKEGEEGGEDEDEDEDDEDEEDEDDEEVPDLTADGGEGAAKAGSQQSAASLGLGDLAGLEGGSDDGDGNGNDSEGDEDKQSVAGSVTSSHMSFATSRAAEKIKERVSRQVKQGGGKKGSGGTFGTRNTNKGYDKGKRIAKEKFDGY